MTPDPVAALGPLLAAEASAEAPGSGSEPGDMEQAVWVRLLEPLAPEGPPADPGRRLRHAVRTEARRTRRTARAERPYAAESADVLRPGPEQTALTAARHRARYAAALLPAAQLSPQDPAYREIAGELGISQGSLGPERSRCLGCLRRMLAAEVASGERWGKQ